MPDVMLSNSSKQESRYAHKGLAGWKGPLPSLNVMSPACGFCLNSLVVRTETGTGTGFGKELEVQLHQLLKALRIRLGYLVWDSRWHRRGWRCVSRREPSKGSDRCS